MKKKNNKIGEGVCKECNCTTEVLEHLYPPKKVNSHYFKRWEKCLGCNKVWFKKENMVFITNESYPQETLDVSLF